MTPEQEAQLFGSLGYIKGKVEQIDEMKQDMSLIAPLTQDVRQLTNNYKILKSVVNPNGDPEKSMPVRIGRIEDKLEAVKTAQENCPALKKMKPKEKKKLLHQFFDLFRTKKGWITLGIGGGSLSLGGVLVVYLHKFITWIIQMLEVINEVLKYAMDSGVIQ